MRQKAKKLRYYFSVGHKVQLKPDLGWRLSRDLEGVHATITRIEEMPDRESLDIETQEENEAYLRIRSVHFWVKVDVVPGLADFYQHNEIMCRYCELLPLPARMNRKQLAAYCGQQFLREKPNSDREMIYSEVIGYLKGEDQGRYLPSHFGVYPPQGYTIDLINLFISGAARLRLWAQESQKHEPSGASMYENQAQFCDDIVKVLMPKPRPVASRV